MGKQYDSWKHFASTLSSSPHFASASSTAASVRENDDTHASGRATTTTTGGNGVFASAAVEARDANVWTLARIRVVGGSYRLGSGVRGVASDRRGTEEEVDAG